MAQTVASVDNPNYAVSPLTTVAGTIVSRRRVKVPVNFQGTYGHQRGAYNYIAIFDIADNESFIDLSKMVICFDFTPNWFQNPSAANGQQWGDSTGGFQQIQMHTEPPSLDQSTQAFFWRLMIGTSQGIKIEEIINYSSFAEIVRAHMEPHQHKEINLLDYSDFQKFAFKDKGLHPLLDSNTYRFQSGQFAHNQTRRVEIRFHHSSFLKHVRFLPLFLFRNGLRIEFEFDDIHRTFCYQLGYNLKDMIRTNMYDSQNGGFGLINWFMGRGTLSINGTDSAVTLPAASWGWNPVTAGAQSIASTKFIPPGLTICQPGGSSNPPQTGSVHTLYVGQQIFEQIMLRVPVLPDIGMAAATQLSDDTCQFYCFPIYIVEAGVITYEAVISFTWLDYLQYTAGPILDAPPLQPSINLSWGNRPGYVGGATTKTLTTAATAIWSPVLNSYTWTTGAPGTVVDTFLWTNEAVSNYTTGEYNGTARNFLTYAFPVYQYNKRKAPYLWRDVANKTISSQLITELTNNRNPTLYVDVDNMFTVRADQATTKTSSTGACGTSWLLAGGAAFPAAGSNTPAPGTAAGIGGQVDGATVFSLRYKAVDPYVIEEFWPGSGGASGNVIQWDYQIKNLEMLLDVVKPSSEDFLKFQQAYQSPSGIPYQYKRIIYKQVISQTPLAGQFQIPLNISVRSLSGIVIAMQDQICLNPGQPTGTDFTKYPLPLISSFMRRGLYRAEVIVGGQTYPVYQLLFQPPGVSAPQSNSWDFSHILESENFFGVGSSSFDQSFHPATLDPTRNYLLAGTYGQNASTIYNAATSSNTPLGGSFYTNNVTPTMMDSSMFVLAISLAKDDVMNFATGIDSSQSGSITVNLYFNSSGAAFQDSEYWLSRPVVFNIWSICDAVFTLQNDANLVRY